jgi:hypothetical protein
MATQLDVAKRKFTKLEMSNCYHTIDEGLEEALKAGDVWAKYHGWNFNCNVHWDASREQFHAEVWHFRQHVDDIYADSLDGIMQNVSNEWGWD